MFCENCGKYNLPNSASCAYCGAQMPPQPPSNQNYVVGGGEKPKTSGMATAAFVLGILSLFTCGLAMPLGVILGVLALNQIKKSEGRVGGKDMAIHGILISTAAIVGAVILFPVFARARDATRKSACINNMKQIGIALSMYQTDYNGIMPSSYLAGNTSGTWDPKIFTRFATELGELPGTGASPDSIASWPELLAPHMKNKDVAFCPFDYNANRDRSTSPVSYWYKAAADKAWIVLGLKKEIDFEYPADQVMFYENSGTEWGQAAEKWGPNVTLTMVFLDGHVAFKRISGGPSNGTIAPTNTTGNANIGTKGEPAWYNKYTTPNDPNGAFNIKSSYDDMR